MDPVEVFPNSSPSSSSSRSPSQPTPGFSTQLQPLPLHPHNIHSCRWDWCRQTFRTNGLLIDHVILQHVRKAQPVRRRDLDMLKRVEEGLGESLSLGVGTEQSQLSLPVPVSSNSIRSSHSPRPSKRARIDPESPTRLHSHSQAELQQNADKSADPTPPTPPTSHPASTPPPHTNAQNLCTPSPDSDPVSSSPVRASFAQLSSPDGTPLTRGGSLPISPSFDVQVANAVRGSGYLRELSNHVAYDRDQNTTPQIGEISPLRISPKPQNASQNSISYMDTSQDAVERQLTQGLDEDVDMDAEGEPEPVSAVDEGPITNDGLNTAPGSPDMGESALSSGRRRQGHSGAGDSELLGTEGDEELMWPDDLDGQQIRKSLSGQSGQSQSQNISQPSQISTSGLSAPFTLKTQPQEYRSPSPSLTDPMSSQPSQTQNPNLTPTEDSPSRKLRARYSFRSGSLRIKPLPNKKQSKRGQTPTHSHSQMTDSIAVDANGDVDGEADMDTRVSQFISQAIAQVSSTQLQSQPQLQSQDSQLSEGYEHSNSYIQLQTQAPYQSQLSQSLSEASGK